MRSQITAITCIGAMLFAAGSADAAMDDAKAVGLMKSSGCSSCHSVEKRLVGPAYKDVSQKRKGEADAIAVLTKAVRAGSKGVYGGPVAMPPTSAAKINDADLHDLLEWILTK